MQFAQLLKWLVARPGRKLLLSLVAEIALANVANTEAGNATSTQTTTAETLAELVDAEATSCASCVGKAHGPAGAWPVWASHVNQRDYS